MGDFGAAVKELKLARTLDPTNQSMTTPSMPYSKERECTEKNERAHLTHLKKTRTIHWGGVSRGSCSNNWADSLRGYQAAKRLVATVTGSPYVDPLDDYYGVRHEELAEELIALLQFDQAYSRYAPVSPVERQSRESRTYPPHDTFLELGISARGALH